jgi:hypothetical protein
MFFFLLVIDLYMYIISIISGIGVDRIIGGRGG